MGTNLDNPDIKVLQPFAIIINDRVFTGTHPACNSLYEPFTIEPNHVLLCSQLSGEVTVTIQTLECDQKMHRCHLTQTHNEWEIHVCSGAEGCDYGTVD